MKHFSRITLTIGFLAVVSSAWAQPVLLTQSPSPAQSYPGALGPYRYTTPEDDYRNGVLNRWQLEQVEGPTPQALQGPNPSGNKGQDVK